MLITFEGDDAGGKTTQARRLVSWLTDLGIPVVHTRNPGDAFDGKIRELLLSGTVCPEAELLLYVADRAQNIAKVVRPALAEGKWVVIDRYIDSTYAYQAFGRGFDLQALRELHHQVLNLPVPQLTLLLRMPPDKAIARLQERASSEIRIGERGGRELMARIHAGYAELACQHPYRIKPIDATGTVNEIHTQVRTHLAPFVGEWMRTRETA